MGEFFRTEGNGVRGEDFMLDEGKFGLIKEGRERGKGVWKDTTVWGTRHKVFFNQA